jgi:sensor histidine kinase regulating citrate/malate metabolism
MKKTYEESAAQYQNMVLSKQVSEVQNIYMTMRGWRHDYHNHMQTLKAHLKLNQTKEAKEYLDTLEKDLDNVNTLIDTGNVNLDAILNSKLSLALKGDIDIKYKAEVPSELTVSDIDLCVLIGNLIDNAVEACDKIIQNKEKKFIRLYIGVLKKQLYITVTNGTDEPVRKLDEEYITAKRGNHGHGLKRINKLVEKYDGFINRKNEPGVFVTEILLPL